MKSGIGVRIVLLFFILVVGSFDKHLSAYFSGEVNAMVQTGAMQTHDHFPVQAIDFHEDVALKNPFSPVPDPEVISVQMFRFFFLSIPLISPHTLWQPPENKA
jgi:hypothetical protein